MKHSLVLRLSFFVLYLPLMILAFWVYYWAFTSFSIWLSEFNLLFLILVGFSLGTAIIVLGALGLSKGLSYLIGIFEYRWLRLTAAWLTMAVCVYDGGSVLYNMWHLLDFSYTTHVVAVGMVGLGIIYLIGFMVSTLFTKDI